jgi:outer membrane protein OmpA-like peptidoglycan-associated protein/ABC-type nitrate/sulfonate/bicarbonate transport system substrate-binding protein
VIVVWLAIIGVAYAAYHYVVWPKQVAQSELEEALARYEQLRQQAAGRNIQSEAAKPGMTVRQIEELAAALDQQIKDSLAGLPPVKHRLKLALDSFSGYAVFRSPEFQQQLRVLGIVLETVDDQADYARRLAALKSGEIPLAVFTIDALISAAAKQPDHGATIVMVIDESTGADAMVAWQQAVPNIDALNRPDARIVITRDSPSEMLARVVRASFDLSKLPDDPWIAAQGAADVFEQFQKTDRRAPRAFVLWEPFVSRATEAGAVRLMDSGRFRGYIVDVLAVQREFLLAQELLVRQIVETYLRSIYQVLNREGALQQLVAADARATGQALSAQQARSLAAGVWWKNTQENYAHFGLLPASEAQGLETLDGMIRKIIGVQLKTGALASDPLDGNPSALYYAGIFQQLRNSVPPFHPSLIAGVGEERVRAVQAPAALSEQQWGSLRPVGTLQVERIVFARSSDRLLSESEEALNRLAETLKSWPQYYLLVQGNSRGGGDPQLDRELALRRAQAAARFLVQAGVEEQRVRAVVGQVGGGGNTDASFVLGQLPY